MKREEKFQARVLPPYEGGRVRWRWEVDLVYVMGGVVVQPVAAGTAESADDGERQARRAIATELERLRFREELAAQVRTFEVPIPRGERA